MADKQKSIFSATSALVFTLVLFSLVGSFAVDYAISGSPAFASMAEKLAYKAANQYLQAVQKFEATQ